VILEETGSQRWLVSPYGERQWTKNARAAGEVTLSRRGYRETVAIKEATAEESVPVLRQYLRKTPLTRPFFDVTLHSSFEQFVRESPRHPVFRIVEQTA
jgi:hypothetical protein